MFNTAYENKYDFLNFFFELDTVTSTTSDDEDNEFYDAQEEGTSVASIEDSSFILKIPIGNRRNSNNNADATGSSSEGDEPKSETHQVINLCTPINDHKIFVANRYGKIRSQQFSLNIVRLQNI